MTAQRAAKPRFQITGTVTASNANGIKIGTDPAWINYSQYAPVPDQHKPPTGTPVTVTYTEDDKGKRYVQTIGPAVALVPTQGSAQPIQINVAPAPTATPIQQGPMPWEAPAGPPPTSAADFGAPPFTAAPPMPYTDKDALIVKQVALKCAVEFHHGNSSTPLEAVLRDAKTMFWWVMGR